MRFVAAAFVVLALAACGGGAARPELQQTLDELVATHVAPGVTAFVSGPKGDWSGAAGEADIAAKQRMQPDARLRLESVSKLWTATVLVELAQEHKLGLDDTLAKWWPALFKGGKATITIRQLLNHTSGLLDNNDLVQASDMWLSQTHDPKLRADLLAVAARLKQNPAAQFDDTIEVRWAAALPLLFEPGTQYHYSNIGYKIAGRIAERATGESLAQLYRRIIIDPLHLHSAVYAPRGPIPGEHPVGYVMQGKRARPATNDGEGGLGAEGGIVSDAQDEATFLRATVQGKLVPTRDLLRVSAANGMYALGTGLTDSGCGGAVYSHNGGGEAWASSAAVSKDGKRVAVLLLNGRGTGDYDYAAALLKLFCRA